MSNPRIAFPPAQGGGARLWATWGVSTTKHTNDTKGGTENLQPATYNLQLLIFILLFLLAAAFLWHPETAMQFQYRGLNRWSGPWDNPNIFGLLMGTGVVLACGLLVASGRLKVAGRVACKRWVWSAFILGCMGCCAVGLLKSYSRGAWLGTLCGLAVLGFRAVGQTFQSAGSPDFPVRCSEQATGKSPAPADKNVRPTMQSGILSCRSCVSWLIKNRLSLAILLGSLLVICFWQFRYTEFHPVRRAFSVGNRADFSWRNRVAAWEGSLAMMADRPLTGFGWNKPERIYDQYYRQPKVSEGMAIQLNHYFILGMSLGLPALLCFAAYLGLSLTRSAERGTRSEFQPRNARTTRNDEAQIAAFPNLQLSTSNLQPHDTCHAAVVVLLIGLWFDGGLFTLATASLFWVLLELGRGTALPARRGQTDAEAGTREQDARATMNPPPSVVGYTFPVSCRSWLTMSLVVALVLTGLLWAKARDPFQREWFSVRISSGEAVAAAVVMPDRGGPFPVVVWCHGSGGSLAGDGETLRQFASLGLAAVGLEYSKTNQAEFDAQFAAVLEAVGKKNWAAKSDAVRHLTPALSPVEAEREAVSAEAKREARSNQPATFNFQPATQIAWIGNSLGAQRQLSFLARHPEQQPVALVRLNGGMVEELRENAGSTTNIQ